MRGMLDGGPAGIAEPDQLCGLVERFARRIVEASSRGGYSGRHRRRREADNALRKRAAADRGNRLGGQSRRQSVAFEMVDGEKRLAGAPGEALRNHRSDDQILRSDRAPRQRRCLRLRRAEPGLIEGAHNKAVEMVKMRARCDLGNHPAIGGVLRKLSLDQIGEDPRTGRRCRDDRRSCVVTARFNSEDIMRIAARSAGRPRPLRNPRGVNRAAQPRTSSASCRLPRRLPGA